MEVEYVVLVNEDDKELGFMEKLLAHRHGSLHRAISVFIFNTRGQLLLQQRASGKYHSAGLWTNTCCSHPRRGEGTRDAAMRRLKEEMGIAAALTPAFTFIYNAALDNGLTEHELDHVFIGVTDEAPVLDSAEVSAWKYVAVDELMSDISAHPESYTEWFKICMQQYGRMITPASH